jgi:hypothetical protein
VLLNFLSGILLQVQFLFLNLSKNKIKNMKTFYKSILIAVFALWAVQSNAQVNPYTWFYSQDSNGDGCLSYQEVPSPSFNELDLNNDGLVCLDEYEVYLLEQALNQLDTNGDGLISQSEFEALYCNTNKYFNDRIALAQSPNGQTLPDSLQSQPDPLGFIFHRDLFTGTNDLNGKLLQGTEVTAIVAHKGKLFASMGGSKNCNHPNNATYGGYAVLRKDTYNGNWIVDYDIGNTSFRISTMYSAKFTTDFSGNILTTPKEILIAANWAGTQSLVIRDDNANTWAVYPVNTNYTLQPGEGFTARSFINYKDKVTGIDYVFMGSHLSNQSNYGYWPSSIYRAAYNPSVAGELQWTPQAELTGVGRVMAFAICNGDLYAACGILDTNQLSGGVFKRIDGINPTWQQVYKWSGYNLSNYDDENRIMRGLTSVPNPNNPNQQVLISFRYYPEPIIERIDPNNAYQATTELNLKDFFGLKWYGQGKYSGPIRCAYNGFIRVKDPVSGDTVSISGLQIYHPDFPAQPHNGSFYLIRKDNGIFDYGSVYDTLNPVDTINKSLDATRYIVKSPFPQDNGSVFYFGGYDGGFVNNRTAWIYRGQLNYGTTGVNHFDNPFGSIDIYPNPTNYFLNISGLHENFNGHITFFNSIGQAVLSEHKTGSLFQINTEPLGQGIYFVQLKADNGQIITRKFIKN